MAKLDTYSITQYPHNAAANFLVDAGLARIGECSLSMTAAASDTHLRLSGCVKLSEFRKSTAATPSILELRSLLQDTGWTLGDSTVQADTEARVCTQLGNSAYYSLLLQAQTDGFLQVLANMYHNQHSRYYECVAYVLNNEQPFDSVPHHKTVKFYDDLLSFLQGRAVSDPRLLIEQQARPKRQRTRQASSAGVVFD